MGNAKKPVDFKLLMNMVNEYGDDADVAEIIAMLAMTETPMSDTVYNLGVCMGILIPKE